MREDSDSRDNIKNMSNSPARVTIEYCNNLPTFVKNALGKKPKNETIVHHSHFLEPIKDNRNSGNSRIWADANERVKLNSINSIIDQSIANNYSIDETSFVLSVAYIESGFNPDAAAATSSASGLGQFINQTGASLGLNKNNRFSLGENSRALVQHIKDLLLLNSAVANSSSQNERFIQTYANYHDGPKITAGTKNFSAKKIPPLIEKFKAFLLSKDCL